MAGAIRNSYWRHFRRSLGVTVAVISGVAAFIGAFVGLGVWLGDWGYVVLLTVWFVGWSAYWAFCDWKRGRDA